MKKRLPISYLKGAVIAVLLFTGSFTILKLSASLHPLEASDALVQTLIYTISIILGILGGVGAIVTRNKNIP